MSTKQPFRKIRAGIGNVFLCEQGLFLDCIVEIKANAKKNNEFKPIPFSLFP